MPGPPYDSELQPILSKLPPFPQLSLESLPELRAKSNMGIEVLPNEPWISHTERSIPGPDCELLISIVRATSSADTKLKPAIYAIFGGGMISGTRFRAIPPLIKFVKQCNAVIFAISYRLAPEHPGLALVEDCYAGLSWIASNADELGIDPARIVIQGASSGAGLTAGVLQSPMLDDRNESVSSKQYVEGQPWTREKNLFAWECVLGDRRGGDNVSIYAAPARANDLGHLPPAFIDIGSADIMRDDAVAYASKLWEAGVQAELHVWPGAFHGFELFAPDSTLAKTASKTRQAWIEKILAD